MLGEADAKSWLAQLPQCDAAAMARLEWIAANLAEENRRQNLVSAASLKDVWNRHIVDSAQLLTHVPRETRGWIDLGTGAGFPGLVIAALLPGSTVYLVESRKRRVDWLERVCMALDLKRTIVVGNAIENVQQLGFCDVISARAFAPLARTLELSARFSTKDTLWLLPKGRSAQQELDALSGWRHVFHVEPSLTDPSAGIIVGTLAGRKGMRS